MPLVQAKCENCGGVLSVDSNLKAANCPHCGTAYIVQDAINYYKSVVNVDRIYTNVVNVNSGASVENHLRAAKVYIQHNDYGAAMKEFETMTNSNPGDYRGWWGEILAYTNNFKRTLKTHSLGRGVTDDLDDDDMYYLETDYSKTERLISNNMKYVISSAPINIKNEMMSITNNYLSVLKESLELAKRRMELQSKMRSCRSYMNDYKPNYENESIINCVKEVIKERWSVGDYIVFSFMFIVGVWNLFIDSVVNRVGGFILLTAIIIWSLHILKPAKKLAKDAEKKNKEEREYYNKWKQRKDCATQEYPALEKDLNDINERIRRVMAFPSVDGIKYI